MVDISIKYVLKLIVKSFQIAKILICTIVISEVNIIE